MFFLQMGPKNSSIGVSATHHNKSQGKITEQSQNTVFSSSDQKEEEIANAEEHGALNWVIPVKDSRNWIEM